MGFRQSIKRQRKIMRKKLEEMAAIPIEKNKLVKARRYGWVIGFAMGSVVGGLATLAVAVAITYHRHPSAPVQLSHPVEK